MSRPDGDRSEFLTISMRDSLESLIRPTGDEMEQAVFYPRTTSSSFWARCVTDVPTTEPSRSELSSVRCQLIPVIRGRTSISCRRGSN